MLRWYGHVESMGDERIAKRVYKSGVEMRWSTGRPTRVWMNGEKEALKKRGWILEQARAFIQDRKEWRGLVSGVRNYG